MDCSHESTSTFSKKITHPLQAIKISKQLRQGLKEKLTTEVTRDFVTTTVIKLGDSHPEQKKLKNELAKALQPLSRSERKNIFSNGTLQNLGAKTRRYFNIFQTRDPLLPKFPGNVMMRSENHFWVQAQGPFQNYLGLSGREKTAFYGVEPALYYTQRTENVSVASFLSSILYLLDGTPIVIILGKPKENTRMKYAAYLRGSKKFKNRSGTIVEIATQECPLPKHKKLDAYLSIHEASIKVTPHTTQWPNKKTKYANTRIIELHGVADSQPLRINMITLAIIFLLSQIKNQRHVLVHCSAGIGRSGMLTLATYLFAHYDKIFVDDEIKTRDNILDALNTLNCSDIDKPGRPGSVQTFKQLTTAVEVAMNIKANQTLVTEIANSPEFKALILTHSSGEQAEKRFNTMYQPAQKSQAKQRLSVSQNIQNIGMIPPKCRRTFLSKSHDSCINSSNHPAVSNTKVMT